MTELRRDSNVWRDRGKPRRYRTDRTCKDKQRYTDEPSVRAGGAVSIAERKNRDKLWCYPCRHCAGWHLTHLNQGKRYEITEGCPA